MINSSYVSGSLTLAGADTFTGVTTVATYYETLILANPLALEDSTFDTSGPGTLSFGTTSAPLTAAMFGGLQGSGTLWLDNPNESAVDLTVGGNNASTTFAGYFLVSGNGGSLTKIGGGTLTLTGESQYTGKTDVQAGILNVQSDAALGTMAGGVEVENGATLQLQGGVAMDGSLTLAGVGVGSSNNGALESVSGLNAWTGPIYLDSTTTTRINSDADTLTLSGGIQNTSGAGNIVFGSGGVVTISTAGIASSVNSLTKDGAGTLELNTANSYTGSTIIGGGTLQVDGQITGTGTVAVYAARDAAIGRWEHGQ